MNKKQINIIAPRGHAKSSIVGGVFPLWHLMYDKGPKLIVLVSRTQDHAIKLLGTIFIVAGITLSNKKISQNA